MTNADPFQLFVEQRRLDAIRRERAYTAWCAVVIVITLVMMLWGCA